MDFGNQHLGSIRHSSRLFAIYKIHLAKFSRSETMPNKRRATANQYSST